MVIRMVGTEATRERQGWTEWVVQGKSCARIVYHHDTHEWYATSQDGRIATASIPGETREQAWQRMLAVARRCASRAPR